MASTYIHLPFEQITGPVEVTVDASLDSIRIKNGDGDELQINDDGSINVVGDNFDIRDLDSDQDSVAAVQSGAWTTGRTWNLDNGSDSVAAVQSGTWTVQQGSPPWLVSQSGAWVVEVNNGIGAAAVNIQDGGNSITVDGTVAATQSGAWTTDRTWNLSSGSDSVASVQSGVWSTGRTWTLASGTDSIAAVQSGTWTTGRTWTLASGTDSIAAVQSGTWNINNISGTVSLPTGAATAALQTQPGVDIGDVTINNTSGAGAVNIQDGGNTITVDGTVAVTQSTSPWVVSATDLDIRDLTYVTDSVTVRQATHDNLNLNANIQVADTDVGYSNPVPVSQVATTATVTSVSGSISSVTLLSANSARKMAAFYNESNANLYIKFGTTASNTSYTILLPKDGYYELPHSGAYTGRIDGIWSSATGAVRITELT